LNNDTDGDGDGTPNSLDTDSDNGGIADLVENGGVDADGDGMVDGFVDANGNGLADSIETANGTGVGMALVDANTNGTADFLEAAGPGDENVVVSQAEMTSEIVNEPVSGVYGQGDVIQVEMAMGEVVTVAGGTPHVQLEIGGEIVFAEYVSGSGSDTLVFEYAVQTLDEDTDGIALTAESLTLNGATISGAGGALNVTNSSDTSTATVDAPMPIGFQVSGSTAEFDNLQTGVEVSSAGDVNGDGFDDFIVGASDVDSYYAGNATGRAFVVFGGEDGVDVDLANLTSDQGFEITGTQLGSGGEVTSVGDVNGDGLDDLFVSEQHNGYGGAAVVFGQTSGVDVAMADIQSGSSSAGIYFTHTDPTYFGPSSFPTYTHLANLGVDVEGLGDINGDGIGDFAISNQAGRANMDTAHVYVVFGNETMSGTFDLDTIMDGGAGGFAVDSQWYTANGSRTDLLGTDIIGGGDINGDGLNDILFTAPAAVNPEDHQLENNPSSSIERPGAIYVVYGSDSTDDIQANDLMAETSDRGFTITGYNSTNEAIDFIGDVNGDGMDDIIVGTGNTLTVVYGRDDLTNIDLGDIATDPTLGFLITGLPEGVTSLESGGDFNGDGIQDYVVGANTTDPGNAYVIYGQTGGGNIDVSSITDPTNTVGFAITGAVDPSVTTSTGDDWEDATANMGQDVAFVGDINGDGFDDIAVSAPFQDFYAYTDDYEGAAVAGATYVIFGNDNGSGATVDALTITNTEAAVIVDDAGTAGDDVINGSIQSEVFLGGDGADTISGNGGVDVIQGGAGDDVISINAENIAALEGGPEHNLLSTMDGGSGTDTLVLNGAGLTLDFGNLDDGRVENFEVIDLTGSGDNGLNISLDDLLDLSDTSNVLRIDGDNGDTVELTGMTGVTPTQETIGGETYNIYTLGEARLEVEDAVAVTVV